jgi:hypothetical protein
MKYAILLLVTLFSLNTNAALIKNVYSFESINGFSGVTPNTQVTWSVVFDTTKTFTSNFSDGPNGITEYGYGDDTIIGIRDFSNQVNAGSILYACNAIYDLSQLFFLVNVELNGLYGTDISDYDLNEVNESISNIIEYSSRINMSQASNTHFFSSNANTFTLRIWEASQLQNGGISVNDILILTGNVKLLSSTVVNEPLTFWLYIILLFFVFGRKSYFRKPRINHQKQRIELRV